MIKKIISGACLTSVLMTTTLWQVSANNTNFLYDVPNDWLRPHIEEMVKEWVMTVYSDGSFKPYEQVLRKKAARYIYNALAKKTDLINANVDVSVKPFNDVPANDFYTKYIAEMKRLHIMNGYGDGNFGYNNKLSRGEELAILLKAKSLADPDFVIPDYRNMPQLIQSEHRFSDVTPDNTFYNVIYTALDNGYIAPNDKFRTNDPISKAETAKLLNNILWKTLAGKDSVKTDEKPKKESPFYLGEKIDLNVDNVELDGSSKIVITVTADTNGKIPYIKKGLTKVVSDNGDEYPVTKVSLISKGDNQFTYGIYVDGDLTTVDWILTISYDDQYISLDATYFEENLDDWFEGDDDWFDTGDDTNEDTVDNGDENVEDNQGDENVEDDANTEEDNQDENVEEDNNEDQDNTDTSDTEDTSSNGVLKVTAVEKVVDGGSIPDAVAVPVFAIDVVNNNTEPMKIESILIKREWLSVADDIKEISFYDGEVEISNKRVINSDDTATLRISSDFEIQPGETKRLTLRATIKDGADSNSQFNIAILSKDDIVLKDGKKVDGDFPLKWQDLKIVDADMPTLEVQNGDTPTVVNVGETQAKVASFYVVNPSSDDVKLRKVTLHNKGDFNEKYFDNMKLVDSNNDNEVLAKDPIIDGNEITFVLDDPFTIEEGTTKLLDVLADITDDKGSEIELYMKEEDDLLAYKSFGDLEFASRVDFTAFDGDTTDHNVISVEGGKITTSAGDDNDEDIAQGDRNITLGRLNITSTDEDVYVDTIRFKLNWTHNWTVITDTNYADNYADWAGKLSNLKLVDIATNKIVSDTISFSENSREIVFATNDVEFGPSTGKTTMKLEIQGNLSSDATTGDTFQFEFMNEVKTDYFEIYSKFDDDLIEQSNVTPTDDILLATKTVTTSELTVQLSSSEYTDTIIKWAEEVPLISFLFHPSTKDAKLKDMKITIQDASGTDNTSSVIETFQNVKLFVGDTQIGDTENVIEIDKYNGTVSFDNIDYKIPKDKDVIITVKADVNENASENDDFYVKIKEASDIHAIDDNNIEASITDWDSTWDNPTNTLYKNTIKEKGVVSISASNDSPKSGLFIPSTEYKTVYKADVKVENEKAKIKTIKFKFGWTSTTDGKANVESGQLYVNGRSTGVEGVFWTDGVTFDLDGKDIEIEKNITTTLELRIKSKTWNEFKRGWVVSFELDTDTDALEFEWVQSKDDLTYNMNWIVGSGSDFRYYYSIPKFERVSDDEYTDVIPSSDQILLVAKVENEGMARVLLESLAIKKTGNPTVTNVRAYMSENGPSVSEQDRVTKTEDYLAFDLGSSIKKLNLTLNADSGEVLDGKAKYITIVWDLNNSLKGNALSISIEPSTENGVFVWHDNEEVNTNNFEDNLYIENLPLTKSWINTQDPVTVWSDTVAPTILSAEYLDTDTNATIDRVVVTLGEAVEGDNVTDFRITDGTDTYRPTEMTISGSQIILTKFQVQDSDGNWADVSSTSDKYLAQWTSGDFKVYYQNSYSGNPIKDLAWNFLVNVDEGSAITITDHAAPLLVSATMTDANGDGIFTADEAGDALELTFSEDIANVTFADFKTAIEIEEAGWDGDFSADVNSIFNDDLVADTTNVVSSGNKITISSDWTNTASSPMITSGDTKIRLKAGQTVIKDAATNTAITGQEETIN